MSDKYTVRVHCVLFGTNINLNKRYVLSTDKDKIIFPYCELNQENIKDLELSLIKYLKDYIFVNDLELLPQLISLHSVALSDKIDTTLDVVYGFIVGHTNNISEKAFWHEFDLLQPNEYTNVLLEVIQKLR